MSVATLNAELSLESICDIFPWLQGLVEDESVTEIMIVTSRRRGVGVLIFYERQGRLHRTRAPQANLRAVEALVMAITRPLGKNPLDEPMLDARLEDGSRVAVCVPPASEGPAITIRRFSKVILTAAELVQRGSLPQSALDRLGDALSNGRNVLVAGGTGSGKTTLLNALIRMFPDDHRILVIEDTIELRVEQLNTVRLEARHFEGAGLSIRDMVKHALRHRPDHIVVGEIRGAEAHDVLQALNTGHGASLTTIHANSAHEALFRMASCAMQVPDRLPWDVVCHGVSSAFDLVVHQHRRPDGTRGVSEIIRVTGFDRHRDNWKSEVVWAAPKAGASPAPAPLPPLGVQKVDGKMVAVRAGPSTGDRRAPVDVDDPGTVAPPPAAGLPSAAVLEQLAAREAVQEADCVVDEAVEGAARPPSDVVVSYPDGGNCRPKPYVPSRSDSGSPPLPPDPAEDPAFAREIHLDGVFTDPVV